MDKKHIFEHFPISILKKIIRTYNLHVKISGYSKMTQSELVMELKKHLIIGDDGSMKVKEVKDVGMIHDYEKKKKVSVKDNKSKGLKKEKKIKESKPEVKKQIKEVKSEPVKEEPKINKEELIKHFREKLNFKEKRIPGRDLSRYIKRIYETYTKDEQKILEEFYIKLIHNEKIDSYHNFRPKIGVFTNYEHKIDELEKRIKAMKDTEYKTKKAKENNEKKIDELEKELKPLKHSNKITNKYIKCIEDSYEKMQNMKDIKTINDVNEYIKLVDIRFRCELHFDEKEEESKPEPKPEEKKKKKKKKKKKT